MASHELRLAPLLSEVPRLIDWVAACCGADGVTEDIVFKMTLSLEEAATNVIKNAFVGLGPPHTIVVRLDVADDAVVAEIVDNGRPFDPTAAPDPDLSLPLEERFPGGLGIHLMRRLMDRLEYRRDGDRNILALRKLRG